MTATRLSISGVLMLVLATIPVLSARPAAQRQNPHAVALADFEKRVDDYLALRKTVQASITPPKTTEKPHEIVGRQEALAAGVRRERQGARPGDVFIPEVAPILREAIRRDLRHRSAKERAAALQQIPAGLALKVNDEYPKSVLLATVPPKLLAEMPRLPDGLEYRFVGRRLILHDTITNLVVDILDDALPRR